MSRLQSLGNAAARHHAQATPTDHSAPDTSAPLASLPQPQSCAALSELARLLGRVAAHDVFAAAVGPATPSLRQ